MSRVDPADRLQPPPLRLGLQPVDPAAQGIAADFDPAMVFFHRFHHRITRRALVEWLARNRNDRRAGDNSG